jgi:hypothetical protein
MQLHPISKEAERVATILKSSLRGQNLLALGCLAVVRRLFLEIRVSILINSAQNVPKGLL